MEIEDETGTITVQVPASWQEVNGASLEGGVPDLVAAPDLAAFNDTWTASGVNVRAVEGSQDANALLDGLAGNVAGACTDSGREDYDDGLYTGRIQYYGQCEGTDAVAVGIAAQPADASFTVLVIVQIETSADVDALDKIIETFTVNF